MNLAIFRVFIISMGVTAQSSADWLDGLPDVHGRDLTLLVNVADPIPAPPAYALSFPLGQVSQESPADGQCYLKSAWQIRSDAVQIRHREEIANNSKARREFAKCFAESTPQ